jgi:hypothetical protein
MNDELLSLHQIKLYKEMKIAFIQVLIMFAITFGIAMFVALIIKILYLSITSNRITRFYVKTEKEKYLRAKRISRIRSGKIMKNLPVSETLVDNEIINYYYGGRVVLKNA